MKNIDFNLTSNFQSGKLLFCYQGGNTSCCFQNEYCSNDYLKSVNGGMETKALTFLKDPDSYLRSKVEYLGYDSCHRIQGIDASICAKECKKLSKSPAAQECKEKQGLFKCCIR